MAVETGYDLPCGRSLEQVWADLDALDEHERTCPHCSTARGSLLALRSATRELAAERIEPRRDLTDRIMAAVRADVRRRGDMLPVRADEPGGLEVSEQAVAVVLRFAADEVEGVRARRCRVRVSSHDEDGEAVLQAELTVVVEYRGDLADVLDTVRQRCAAACAASVGLRLGTLDLVVADLYEA
ncbi:Asp23/Gls24 family envelope stress response protein [Amycolatopsis acidicola]|uniref:Asp23/Gls24 family envelope stress response protein n=1 Tax=Amycolatopsis acidicola TaxID=2596893 RepID=A0A5N0VNU8_9PSEU|nr:Asp23/Gls24 family envelope stress response protein [Amycolatopsis acidicola]KAA9166301.1 Asp23/Gls24 family envelope stress response protein [Amycolatopsis acidicola]